MTDSLANVGDAADSLCNPIRVHIPIQYWDDNRNKKVRYHDHTAPSLLDQLHMARIPGLMYVEDDGSRVRSTPRSVPPARLEAINAYLAIEAGAATWVREVGLSLRDTPASNVRALVGAQAASDTMTMILSDLRRWYGWAATLSGWERAPWRPDAPCPLCSTRGGLRIHLARRTATCTACGEVWTQDTIGILGAHIEAQAATPMRDVAKLRLDAVLARRADEAKRVGQEPRPRLPYIEVEA